MEPFVINNAALLTINPWWVVGIVDGEGNFSVEIARNNTMRLGYAVTLSFNVTQRDYNRIILDKCFQFFGGIGVVRLNKKTGLMMFRVRSQAQIRDIVLPFFDRYPLQGVKALD